MHSNSEGYYHQTLELSLPCNILITSNYNFEKRHVLLYPSKWETAISMTYQDLTSTCSVSIRMSMLHDLYRLNHIVLDRQSTISVFFNCGFRNQARYIICILSHFRTSLRFQIVERWSNLLSDFRSLSFQCSTSLYLSTRAHIKISLQNISPQLWLS